MGAAGDPGLILTPFPMLAAICDRYGPPDTVEIREVPTPSPKETEVLIRVRVTTVNSGDSRVRSFNLPRGFGLIGRLALGLSGPRQPILGTEASGDVVAVGEKVSRFAVGDRVFAFPGARMGAHAEFVCIRETGAIVHIPEALSYEQGAALSFGGTTVLDFFRRASLKPGDHILINGASGAVGTAAIQIAKAQGARVTAVCSGTNGTLVRSLGADHVVDYTRTDFAATGERYDVIMDAVGDLTVEHAKPALADGGRLLLLVADLPTLLLLPWVALTERRIKVIAGPVKERADDLVTLAKLAAEGRYQPVIDRTYPFANIVDAYRYVDSGRKRGSVLLSLG